MIRSVKLRLIPNEAQEIMLRKSVGVSRFTYNWGLSKWKELYNNGDKPSGFSLKKLFNNTIKKEEEYSWLKEVGGSVTVQAFTDLQNAFNNFFKGKAKYPSFKSKRQSRQSFYVRYNRMTFKNNTVNIEKVGRVKYTTNYKIPKLKPFKIRVPLRVSIRISIQSQS